MVEIGENLALSFESEQKVRTADKICPNGLDSHSTLKLAVCVALGEVQSAHTTGAEPFLDPVSTDLIADAGFNVVEQTVNSALDRESLPIACSVRFSRRFSTSLRTGSGLAAFAVWLAA